MAAVDDRGQPNVTTRGFESLAGSPSILTTSASDQTFTLTQVIPPGGCQFLLTIVGGSGACMIRKDATPVTTSNGVPVLCNTMTTWGINSGDTPRIVADAASVGAVATLTLGNGS